jgi:heme A synthase
MELSTEILFLAIILGLMGLKMLTSAPAYPQQTKRLRRWGVSFMTIAALVLLVGVWAQQNERRLQRERATWPIVVGRVTRTRIRTEEAVRSRPERIYHGECLVEYVVDRLTYGVWVASGYFGFDHKVVADNVRDCPFATHQIRYDPKDPMNASSVD